MSQAAMAWADFGDVGLHWRSDGPVEGPALMFANSLGTDMRMWDPVLAHLPAGLCILRYDMRGHGLSSCPPGPYAMGALVRDAERLLEHAGVKGCVFVGLSIGGMVAQGLAVKRPDLVRAAVFSNTAARIGTAEMWAARIAAVGRGGVEAVADAVMERWFAPRFLARPEAALWRAMLARTPAEGYAGCCTAIAGTDLLAPTSGLRLPVLGIAGSEDGATPPDLVRETVDLVPGARFALMRGVGHLPCVEAPEEYAALLTGFLRDVGHL